MQNVNEQILEDYRLLVSRLDLMKAEVDEVNRANNKMRKAFNELLEAYQLELDQRDNQFYDRQETDYYWLDKAGILD
jgi:MoxR-like ATPase